MDRRRRARSIRAASGSLSIRQLRRVGSNFAGLVSRMVTPRFALASVADRRQHGLSRRFGSLCHSRRSTPALQDVKLRDFPVMDTAALRKFPPALPFSSLGIPAPERNAGPVRQMPQTLLLDQPGEGWPSPRRRLNADHLLCGISCVVCVVYGVKKFSVVRFPVFPYYGLFSAPFLHQWVAGGHLIYWELDKAPDPGEKAGGTQ